MNCYRTAIKIDPNFNNDWLDKGILSYIIR